MTIAKMCRFLGVLWFCAAAAVAQENQRVIILLRDQPQREIAERVMAASAPRILDAEGEYRRLAAQPLAFDPIVQSALARRDDAVVNARREIARQVEALVGPAQRRVEDRLARLGARAVRRYQVINAMAAELPAAAVAELERSSDVAGVFPDEQHEALLNFSVPALGAPALWDAGITGAGVAVGVLDSGVFSANPAFNGVNVIDQPFGEQAVSGACFNDTPQSAQDLVGHGTHVAGTIAGRGFGNFSNYFGVARGVTTVYNLKIGWSQTKNSGNCKGGASSFTSDVIAAFDWAVKNTPVRLFNYSYGSLVTVDDDGSARLFDLLADNYGLTLVISAGNSGPGASTLGSPGIGYNGITVAAVNDSGTSTRTDDRIAEFSSRGPTVGGRSKPDIAAPGQMIYAAAYNSNGLIGMQGTSMAAPHITGAAALLMQAGITDPLAVKAVLINQADGGGWTPEFGWGYANLNAVAQRREYVKDTLAPATYRFYRGSTGGFFKSTLTWNRHIGTAGNGTTSFFNPLHLYLYSRGNNTLLFQSERPLDNVKQVGTSLNGEVVIKVKAGSANFVGVNAEPYALAFSAAGFTASSGPALTAACTAPGAVPPGSSFAVNCELSNTGELDAFSVTETMQLPAGFGGENTQNAGTVAAGARVLRTFQLTAPATGGSFTLTMNAAGTAYGEQVGAAARVNVSVSGVAGPSLVVNPASLTFNFTAGGTAPPAQTINVASSSGAATFTVTASDTWLSARASGGNTPGTVTVSIVTAGLTARTYNGTVTIQASGAVNTVQRVPVTLTVSGTPRVTVVNSLTTGSVTSGGCTVPAQVSSFNAGDPQAMVWFSVNGTAAGDQPSAEWLAPDQSIYHTGSWTPVASPGNYCFWAGIDIAGKTPASKPGRWTVNVRWNGAALFTLSFTIGRSANVLNSMTTAALPRGSSCPVPAAQDAFLTSDASVIAWFLVNNTAKGDVASIAWYQPDGTRYRSASWDALTDSGTWCFNDSMAIAGKDAAALPGTWTAKVSWNGTQLFTLTFTISPPVIVEASLTSKLKPSGGACVSPPPSSNFVPSDSIALVWFSVSKAKAGDIPSVDWYAPDGSYYNSAEFDPIPEDGNWCFWSWNNVAGTDMASKFGTWTAEIYWNDASIQTQEFNVVPVNVLQSMTTKAIPTGNGCPTPVPASTFVPADKSVFFWFLISGGRRGDVPALKFKTPSGSTFSTATWDPLPDGQNRCLWAWIDVAGTSAASTFGTWTVETTWNGIPLETERFTIVRTDPGTPTSMSMAQDGETVLSGIGQDVDLQTPAQVIPRPGPTGRRNVGSGQGR